MTGRFGFLRARFFEGALVRVWAPSFDTGPASGLWETELNEEQIGSPSNGNGRPWDFI